MSSSSPSFVFLPRTPDRARPPAITASAHGPDLRYDRRRMIKKPTLERDLTDLLGQNTSRPAPVLVPGAAPAPARGDELAKLPLDLLQRGKYQPRVDMRPETLQELADSIKAQGVVQPIVVRPIGVPGLGESQRYEIIADERRWRAAQMAG